MVVEVPELLVDWAGDGFQVATVETGSPARVAGQFTNFQSCSIQAGDAVDLALAGLDETEGAVIVWYDPDVDHGSHPEAAPRLWEWGDSASNRILLFHNRTAAETRMQRRGSAAGDFVSQSDPYSAGDPKVVYGGWDATTVEISVDGATVTSVANTAIPTLSATVHQAGTSSSKSNELDGAIAAIAWFARKLTAAEIAEFNALTRPPLFGEIVGRAMLGLWVGEAQLLYDDARDIVTPELTQFSASTGDRGGLPLIRKGRAGQFGATLRNSDGRYSPANTGSPLTGLILEGRDVRLRMASLADHHDLWYGRLEEPVVPRWRRGRLNQTQLRASGMLRQLRNRPAILADQIDQDTGAIMTALFTAATDLTALIGTFATGATTLGVYFPGNDRTVQQVVREIERQELGWLRETRAGLLDFDDRHYRRTGARLTSQATISDAGGAALTQSEIREDQPGRNTINSSQVGVRQFDDPLDSAILWSYAGPAISIAPAASITIVASWPSEITDPEAGYVSSWETILEADMTLAGVAFGDLTITVVEGARQLEITIANGGGSDADITTLDVRGVSVNFLDPVIVSLLEQTDVRRAMPNPPTWLSSVAEGEAFNEHVTSKLDPPPRGLTVRQHPRRAADSDLATLLDLDLSDRITIVADNVTQVGVSGDFHIELIEHRWRHGRNSSYEMVIRATQVDPVAGWILGDGTLSELGVTTVLTY